MSRPLTLLPMLALLLQAQTLPPSPADIYGPLFDAVQAAQIFPDGKTFADAVPRATPDAILAAYAREKPAGKAALTAFVRRHFSVRGDGEGKAPLRDRIRALWPVLGRAPFAPVAGSSALGLDHGYVVPGDRFQEIYYWDSYFTMLGLKADGQAPLIEAMLADFVDLVERYGHVPNGTRTYYLSRSQPPFLALMMDLSDDRDPVLAKRRLAALIREHEYWMAGANGLDAGGADRHVVRMPDGSLLNRYWDARESPRDESWREDRETAAKAAPRPATVVQRDLRAAAESGWDFSSRWLADPMRLETIHTTDIVPVDLNSLLWVSETRIAARANAAGDPATARRFAELAAKRKVAIDRYLWVAGEARFADWDRIARRPTASRSAVSLFPLFAGHASPEQARAVAATTRATLVGEGGLRTTGIRTGQQWDAPNGWAPLQWIAISGLRAYGEHALAARIAAHWQTMVEGHFVARGELLEKYDVEERRPGGGGEYPTQDGFGWTNGVTAAMLERWPDLTPPESTPR